MMQGVLARGTARSIAHLAPYVAGKTGTSDNENDAWFVGFTNDVTVAVWLGYDNADGKRRTLGGGSTGGGRCGSDLRAGDPGGVGAVAPRTALAPPSPEAKRQLSCKAAERGEVNECLRTDAKGRVVDTQNFLISRAHASARRERDDEVFASGGESRAGNRAGNRGLRMWSFGGPPMLRSWGWGRGAPQQRYYWRW